MIPECETNKKERFLYLPPEYYPCYSTRILRHLVENGFESVKDKGTDYTGKFLNAKTNRWCYPFLQSEELSKCIAEVSNVKTPIKEMLDETIG